ncbi:MAG: ABC transporter ATP-binding protein [Pseudomonadota bacterium]|nr:ABC transporter ATP-binding protein [Pseudomonadota bacterium]
MIEVKSLSHSFNTTKVLDNISFTIHQGEYVALLGQSGAGKSTLMHILGLLQKPQYGDYWLNGQHINQLNNNQKAKLRNQKIGFIFQQYHLLSELSVFENIKLPWQYSNHQNHDHLDELVTSLGITHLLGKKPSQLSGGEQQRVAIARSMINSPSLLLADEPTGALDQNNGKNVMALLKKHRANKTLLLVTHNQTIAQQCDRIIQLKDGIIS